MATKRLKRPRDIRVAPAMAAGAGKKLWDMMDVVRMADEYEHAQATATENADLERLRDEASTYLPKPLLGPNPTY